MMETLTQHMADRGWALIEEVEALGGMAKAIESGVPKLRIEEAAAAKQARIDRGEDTIVGVNKYRLEDEEEVEILDIDNRAVRDAQLERLAKLKAARDDVLVQSALNALTDAAKSGEGNLLALSVDAIRARATVGEVSAALEAVYGRFNAKARTVSGVYGGAYDEDEDWAAIKRDVAAFRTAQGRPPKMLVCKMGQDGHDRGAKVIASAFADVGFDIELTPMFSTPEEARSKPSRNQCTLSVFLHKPPDTQRWCRSSSSRCATKAPTTSSWCAAASYPVKTTITSTRWV